MNVKNIPSNIADTVQDVGDALRETASTGLDMGASALRLTGERLRAFATVAGSYAAVRTLYKAADLGAVGARFLQTVGLQRRRGAFVRLAMGAGLVVGGAMVGAGIALFLAPRSGTQLRSQLGRGLRILRHDSRGAAGRALETVKSTLSIGHKTTPAVTDASTAEATRPNGPRADGAMRIAADFTKSDH